MSSKIVGHQQFSVTELRVSVAGKQGWEFLVDVSQHLEYANTNYYHQDGGTGCRLSGFPMTRVLSYHILVLAL